MVDDDNKHRTTDSDDSPREAQGQPVGPCYGRYRKNSKLGDTNAHVDQKGLVNRTRSAPRKRGSGRICVLDSESSMISKLLARVFLGLITTLLAALITGCSSSTPDEPECDPPHPAFRLLVDAMGRTLPDDVSIRVLYGGGVEFFQASGENKPMVVLCKVQRRDSTDNHDAGYDDAGYDRVDWSPIMNVTCDLWTNGAATVTVAASGYATEERKLEAKTDSDCGLLLTQVVITLVQER